MAAAVSLDTAQLIAALEFYAERANHWGQPGEGNPMQLDGGNLAKTVLAGKPAYVPQYAKPLGWKRNG